MLECYDPVHHIRVPFIWSVSGDVIVNCYLCNQSMNTIYSYNTFGSGTAIDLCPKCNGKFEGIKIPKYIPRVQHYLYKLHKMKKMESEK